jgi:hypothetical protein
MVKWILVVVQNLELADGDRIRLQIDAGIESRVGHAEIGRGEGASLDVDGAIEMRVVSGSRDFEVCLHDACDVCHVRCESLDHTEIDLAARDIDVDRFAGRRLAMVVG